MGTIENTQFTVEELELFEKKVRNNEAEKQEYEKFEKYISFFGLGAYLKDKIRENGLSNLEDYLYERNRRGKDTSIVTGTILGILSAIKRHLTNKLY